MSTRNIYWRRNNSRVMQVIRHKPKMKRNVGPKKSNQNYKRLAVMHGKKPKTIPVRIFRGIVFRDWNLNRDKLEFEICRECEKRYASQLSDCLTKDGIPTGRCSICGKEIKQDDKRNFVSGDIEDVKFGLKEKSA